MRIRVTWIDFQSPLDSLASHFLNVDSQDCAPLHTPLAVAGVASTSSFQQTSSHSPGRVQLSHHLLCEVCHSPDPTLSSLCTEHRGGGFPLWTQPSLRALSGLTVFAQEAVIMRQ